MFFDDCLTYDGGKLGDADGLLSDESMVIDYPVLCEASARCGLPGFDVPNVRAEAQDCAGNTGSDARDIPLTPPLIQQDCQPALGMAKLPGTTEISWIPVFEAEAYDVVRGDVQNLGAGAGMVDLGAVTCVADDTTDTTVTDSAVPPPNTTWFYVVRTTHFGNTSDYGWSSSDEPRQPASGDCTK